jgi:hypothetical protein
VGGSAKKYQQYGGTIVEIGSNSCVLEKRSITANDGTQVQTPDINSTQNSDPSLGEFREINNKFFDVSKRVKDDISSNGTFDKVKYKGDYAGVIDNFKAFIDKNPGSSLSKTAFTTAVHCFKTVEDNEAMKGFLEGVMKDKHLANMAKRYMIDYHSSQNDFTSALSTADEILHEQKAAIIDTGLVCDVLYAKGLIYSHDLNEPEKAVESFSAIVNNYPGAFLVDAAVNELRILGKEIIVPQQQKEAVVSEKPEFSIGNYPNPFNPVTKINYLLPQDGNVKLQVFDITGRLVTTLADEVKVAGSYTASWDGSNLSSGVYFVRLVINDLDQKQIFDKTLKIQLLK